MDKLTEDHQRLNDLSKLFDIAKWDGEITSVKIIRRFTDDHLPCAEVEINGLKIAFLWLDSLGFLEYWEDSPKALIDLKAAIRHEIDIRAEENTDVWKKTDPIAPLWDEFLTEVTTYRKQIKDY